MLAESRVYGRDSGAAVRTRVTQLKSGHLVIPECGEALVGLGLYQDVS